MAEVKQEFTVSESVYNFASRDIVLVYIHFDTGDYMQPMYLSTGRNSGMPNTWLPFDGIAYNGSWFDKTNYVTPQVPSEFHRFGNQLLKNISESMRTMEIPSGEDENYQTINRFLGYGGR